VAKATLPPFEFHKVIRVVFVAGAGFLLLGPQTLLLLLLAVWD